MPAKTYICTNKAGGCTRAFQKELITLEAGQEPDCAVKNCRENLKLADSVDAGKGPKKGPDGPKPALFAALVIGVLVLGVGGFFGWREYVQPHPERIETELSGFYRDLPPAQGETK